MKNKVGNVIFFIIIAGSLLFLYLKRSSLGNIRNISLPELLILLFLSLAAILTYAFGYKHLIRIFDIKLKFREWFGLTVCNAMFNYYMPAKGGIVVRAFYLNKQHGLRYSHYAALSAVSYVLSLCLFFGTGFLALMADYLITGVYIREFAIIFLLIPAGAGLFLGGLRLVFKYLRIRIRPGRVASLILQIREGLSLARTRKRPVACFSIFVCLYLLIMAVRLFLCFHFLDADIGFSRALMIRSLTQFSFLLSILPGNLGLKEGIIVYASGLMQIAPEQAVLAALLDRAVGMIITFGFGTFFSHRLIKKWERG